MKIHSLLLLLFLSISGISAQHIHVASYNIRNANDGDARKGNGWKQRCPVVCKLIQYHDFDLFGSQEVLHAQLNDMLDGLPGYASIGVGRDDGKEAGEYTPVFYKKERFDLLDSGNFWLAENTTYPNKGWDAALPRICTWGKFKDKTNGLNIWFFNIHFDHVGVEARKQSSLLILKKIKEQCGTDAVILTGDFNVDQTNESYEILSNSGTLRDSYQNAQIVYAPNGTFNGFDPNRKTDSRIDHIFVTPHFVVERYGILTDTYRSAPVGGDATQAAGTSSQDYVARVPSDHFPVAVTLALKAN
ncbi:endonuclease [Parabacteroides sp. 52]|uniref:endonuclease/exonuclease/phosphatase family protein n=1 Tax=unclassified Parabacteroides TaxID=2649774 RepID=UPI0013D872E5|nr:MULTISPECIES: endonuclease/exonuclease/phosphatase family protein [unclassified Parabacteroides]MDH6534599.1 endonuclease/exonuclease/phosphatase family metal-dependent hydrolase [Parabacteroides sp. PM5-20]NDV55169.1 endonuclease [Parabacteroides sp. 52]